MALIFSEANRRFTTALHIHRYKQADTTSFLFIIQRFYIPFYDCSLHVLWWKKNCGRTKKNGEDLKWVLWVLNDSVSYLLICSTMFIYCNHIHLIFFRSQMTCRSIFLVCVTLYTNESSLIIGQCMHVQYICFFWFHGEW